MDDKQRAQGLKAIAKASVAVEGAGLELEDILANGCGCPDTVKDAIQGIDTAREALHQAHAEIRRAHIVKANREEGSPLPFPEGEEATRVPKKGRKKKGGKDAAAGEDAPGEDAA